MLAITASKERSGYGICRMSMRSNAISGRPASVFRAASSIPSEKSERIRRRQERIRLSLPVQNAPVPQPSSSTDAPGAKL